MSYRDEVMAISSSWREALDMRNAAAEIAARADARIAELEEVLREARDCVLDCHNAEVMQRHSRAERAHYYAGLLAQVDAVLAKVGADE